MSRTNDSRTTAQVDTALRGRRAGIAGGLGTLIEGYDFSMYGYMSVFLAPVFFPSDDPFASLMLTLGVFAASYVVRPLGGIVFGHIGDRVSRRTALLITLMVMGVSSFLVGLLPGYAAIGIAAPILLLLLRLLQGFSVGGEVAGAATLVSEASAARRRGLLGSLNPFGATLGFAAASGISALVTALTTEQQMQEWGWRIPFLVAGPLAVACYLLRRRLAETHRGETSMDGASKRIPLIRVLRERPVEVLLAAGLSVATNGTAYFGLTFLSIHMIQNVGYDSSAAFAVTTIAVVVAALLMPLAGLLADRIGLIHIAIVGTVGYLLLSYLGLSLINSGVIVVAAVGFLLIMVNTAPLQVATYAGSPELFPADLRYTGMALGYNIGVLISGGVAPAVCLWLVRVTNNLSAPAFWAMGAALIGLVSALSIIWRRKRGKTRLPD